MSCHSQICPLIETSLSGLGQAGGGGGRKRGGRKNPTETDYVYGRVTAGRGASPVLGGVEEGPNLGGRQGA